MSISIRVSALLTAAALLLAAAEDCCAQVDLPVQRVTPSGSHGQTREVIASGEMSAVWESEGSRIIELHSGGEDGRAGIRQGQTQLRARKVVVVESKRDSGYEVRVYARDNVQYVNNGHTRHLATHQMYLQSSDPVRVVSNIFTNPESPTLLMKEAVRKIGEPARQPVLATGFQTERSPFVLPPEVKNSQAASRRIQVRPRSSEPLQFDSFISRDTVPEEQVYKFTGGVNVLIEGLQTDVSGQPVSPGVLDLSADRVIIWTDPDDRSRGLESSGTGTIIQSKQTRLQVYLEGNILVRQGRNTVTATHAFFDANNDRALLMNAELRSLLPQSDGTFRIRAERLRQTSLNRFHAQNAWTTTSPYGKPGYRLQASDIFVEPGPISPFTEIDSATGLPKNGQPLWVTAVNSRLLIGDTPVLSLPRITAPAEDPHIPIRGAAVRHDRIFGAQVKTVWNLTKVLGQRKQEGMDWDLLVDYMHQRGPGIGVQGEYNQLFSGTRGSASVLWQLDHGADNLGLDRQNLAPDQENRGQIIWRHKQQTQGPAVLFGEIGFISDRNYRESFHEQIFDSDKDAETLLGIRADSGAYSATLWSRYELNDFQVSTDWLPRMDLYSFSAPLFGGAAYWSSHSMVGYGRLDPGAPPTDPNDVWTPGAISGVTGLNGLVAMTRHQIDAPFQMGPVTINPFVMGEAAVQDEALTAEEVDRYLVSGGVRASLSATRVMPFVQSEFWNLNGLAHRSENTIEYRATDVSRNIDEFAQYNEIDDNAQERGRIRYTIHEFGGLVPTEFDPRNYAIRQGAGVWVSSPWHELVDDQQMIRFVSRNRLQTKAGPTGSQRIRDWVIVESGLSFFPDGSRDNFGEDVGLIFGNYRWNISDRTSLLAEGIVDLFSNSQDVWSIGLLNQRSTRGSVYMGYRQVKARNFVDSQTLVASYSYRMSPKWISTGSVSYDVAVGESRGSSLTFSRLGLDWIVHLGFGIDTSKDNVGVALAIEPRFGPPSPTNMSYLLGLQQ
ncbi:MAG TPA: hypothetical protein DCG12_04925 [Planctomycetaceae bacterium]|nr:hypothetical protein [Planctomycetaceae bacterium]